MAPSSPHLCELQQRQEKGAPRAAKDLDGERRLQKGAGEIGSLLRDTLAAVAPRRRAILPAAD